MGLRRRTRALIANLRKPIDHLTPKKDIQALISSLHPMNPGIDLVRIGGDRDGGYLLPNDMEGIRACFSPGVSKVADFELALAERGLTCYLADASVASAPESHPNILFEQKYIGAHEDATFTTLSSWVNRHEASAIDMILQMDIEGFEYEVLFDSSADLLRRFRIIVIEFHGLDRLIHRSTFDMIRLSFQKVLKDFVVVHLHPNNCCGAVDFGRFEIPRVMEFTFLRKDRLRAGASPAKIFPHPLDRPNLSTRPALNLPRCWYA